MYLKVTQKEESKVINRNNKLFPQSYSESTSQNWN